VGGAFEGYDLFARNAGDIERSVRAAIADALRHNGAEVADGAGLALVATLREFWMQNARPTSRPMVAIDYVLEDGAGNPLWRSSVSSSGSFPVSASLYEADFIVSQTLGTALRGISTDSRVAFQQDEFRELMRTRAATAAP